MFPTLLSMLQVGVEVPEFLGEGGAGEVLEKDGGQDEVAQHVVQISVEELVRADAQSPHHTRLPGPLHCRHKLQEQELRNNAPYLADR